MRLNIRLIIALFGYAVALIPIAAGAQAPIIVETTGKKQPAPTPKLKPTPPPAPKPTPPPFSPPKLLYKALVRRAEGNAIFAGDSLFLAGGTALYRLDGEGRTQWAIDIGEQRATPAADDRRVFLGNEKGVLTAVTQRTGASLWQFASENGAGLQTPPAIGAGRVYVEANDNNIYALNIGNGQLLWKFTCSDGSLGYAAPIFDNGALYAAGETTLYQLDAATGKEQWKSVIGGKSLSTPTVTEKTIYLGGDGSGVTAVSRAEGKPLWNFKGNAENDWFGQPLVVRNRVYVTTYGRKLYALDATTGAVRWSAKLTGPALARPALDAKRGVLYVTCKTYKDEPSVLGFDISSANRVWDYGLDTVVSAPLVIGDRLYVNSTNGFLYAFGLR